MSLPDEQAATTPELFHLVEETDAEPLRLTTYPTADALSAYLRELMGAVPEGSACRVYLFRGTRLYLTKGRWRYLVGDGVRIPLFDGDPSDEIDEDGLIAPAPSGGIYPRDGLELPAEGGELADGTEEQEAGPGADDESWD